MIDNLNTVLKTLADRHPLLRTLKQLQRLISGLSADRKPICDSLVTIDDLAAATSDFLEDARAALKADISRCDLSEPGRRDDEVEGVLQRAEQARPSDRHRVNGSWFNFYLCDFDGRIVSCPAPPLSRRRAGRPAELPVRRGAEGCTDGPRPDAVPGPQPRVIGAAGLTALALLTFAAFNADSLCR